ncbi:MAG: DUF1553 domain-containing protein [Verrucomicrobiales bacterium]|nr:DUF1553 domain-containing protein [Verrucomicrobiales bacterium]
MKVLATLILGLVLLVSPGSAAPSLYEAGPMTVSDGEAADASERIDQLVLSKLTEVGLKPAPVCSDEVFLRRVYLVTIGTLPREDEVRDFLATEDEVKRTLVVEHLLDRPEFADYWSMKWGDLLRIKAEFPIKLWPNAVQAYHHWVHDGIRTNKPYHEFAREILIGSGSNFRQGEVNFYRAMQDRTPRGIASTVALTLMGERTKNWPERKLEAMAGFFSHVAYKSTSEWKEEIVYFDPTADQEKLYERAIFPDGSPVELEPSQRDPRAVFADWLIRPENPYFSKAISNRIWSWLMGRGIVEEPDDMGPHNPPSNPELLAFLETEFNDSRCDVKHLFRIILNSQTFQLSSIPIQNSEEAAAHFAHYPLRRMEAEVLIDALNEITGTKEDYSSPIPEPFTFVPDDIRGIALADGSITSSFLELFGRPPRDTGFESERARNVTAAQRLHLLNSSHIRKKIKVCPLVTWGAGVCLEEQPEMIEKIYLHLLSRYPTEDERLVTAEYFERTGASSRDLAADLVWALMNQPEFYFIH